MRHLLLKLPPLHGLPGHLCSKFSDSSWQVCGGQYVAPSTEFLSKLRGASRLALLMAESVQPSLNRPAQLASEVLIRHSRFKEFAHFLDRKPVQEDVEM